MEAIYSHTMSVCEKCLNDVRARIILRDNKVYMQKFCPSHGRTEALLSSDSKWYEDSRMYVKPGQIPLSTYKQKFTGCPSSCGFCPEHQQHTCLPVVEINYRCNLNCPVCLKNDLGNYSMSVKDFAVIIDKLKESEGKIDVLNLSGGEPLLHPELEELFKVAADKGVTQLTVSTNGLEFIEKPQLRELFKKYGAIAALQFDGFNPETYIQLRGTDLSKEKLKLIKLFEDEQLDYSIICTVLNTLNIEEVTSVTDFFFRSKALSLMFQPVAFTGQANQLDIEKFRVTVPDVIREIEKNRFVGQGDFNALPCSHYSCFALSYYFKVDNESFYPLKKFLGDEDYLNIIANRTLPGLNSDGVSFMKQKLYEFWSAADSSNMNERVMERIKNIIKEMNANHFSDKKALDLGKGNMKAIFIHHFMDANNFDYSRLIKCCNPYPREKGIQIPICANNLFFDNNKYNK